MRATIAGRDTLALMPTGSGKSLTYQLAAMLRPEPTLVLSPLIALMKDQVDKLPPQIASTATFVNSSLSAEETASRLAGVSSGETRLVYAAPERLRQPRFVDLLADVGIGQIELKLRRGRLQRIGKLSGQKLAAALQHANAQTGARQARCCDAAAVTGADHNDLIMSLQLGYR